VVFAGVFGKYDKAQLQRGLKVYKEVCSACHSMKRVAFRNLEDLGYTEAQVKAFAADYEVQDGPNGDGEMFTRKARSFRLLPVAVPERRSGCGCQWRRCASRLLAACQGTRRRTRLSRSSCIDMIPIVGGYQEGGPDYIHALITGYVEPPAGVHGGGRHAFQPAFLRVVLR
jgi:ubiquinol-cytochrome c reductase cytochrome c1 subunit